MSNQTLNLTESLYEYLLAVSLREHEVLAKLRAYTATLEDYQMQISPEQGQFMQLLIELMGAQKTLEIGVFTGYSTLAVALALPENGRVVACDVSEEWTTIARDYWQQAGVSHKIDLRLAPATQTLDELIATGAQESFDFAFIDANKSEYPAYYEKSLTLLRRGGLIAVDNTLWDGAVADPKINDTMTRNIRAFNEKLFRDERISLSLLPVGDGLTLARKK